MIKFLKTTIIKNYINRLNNNLGITIKDLQKRFSNKIFVIFFVNILLIFFQLLYLKLRYAFLNAHVPLWYTRLWGDTQLAAKHYLYVIPLISFLVLAVGIIFFIPIKRYFIRFGIDVLGTIMIATNFLLTASLVRIIFISSTPFEPLIKPLYLDLLLPFAAALISVYALVPSFINFAQERDLVTNPDLHVHPAMLLAKPSARGGGFVYGIIFLFLAIIFVGFPANVQAFYLSLLLLAILGYVDDYQNTHPESKLRFMENPYLRLSLLFLIVSISSVFGTKIFALSIPFGNTMVISSSIVSTIVTTFWIVWVLNVLSWSNGIDGQYAGIVGIASFVIILLALRFSPLQIEHKRIAVLAAISVGLSFGFIRYTWHPSKIMWGFGAMCAGLVLSFLSISINSKIITSIMIILIPFLDALVTALRRILQKKNPLKGDRGHLHHLLLNRGWSPRKISLFYWITTAVFGGIGYLSAERYTIQTGYFLVGIVAFIIVILNLKLKKDTIAPHNQLDPD